jgi:hypothetical protein
VAAAAAAAGKRDSVRLDKRAKLSVVLIAIGFGTGAIVASGAGARAPRSDAPAAPSAPRGPMLSDIASPAELKLWNNLGCITCHGAEARGSPMAPDLTKVLPLYFAKFGTDDAVREELVAYLIDPQGSPKLRADGVQFPNPMPAIEKMSGGTKAAAATLAGLLVRLAK